jgi:hypothetical protein
MTLVDGLYGAIYIQLVLHCHEFEHLNNNRRPKNDLSELWSFISTDKEDIKAMAKAATKPELIVLSDWSRFSSEEYWKANEDSNLLVL